MHLIWSLQCEKIVSLHLWMFLFIPAVQFWILSWRLSWLWFLTSISPWAPWVPERGGSAWPPTSSPSSGSPSTWTRRPTLTTVTVSSWRAATSGGRGHYIGRHCYQILIHPDPRDYETNKFSLEALRSEMQETEAVHIFKVVYIAMQCT